MVEEEESILDDMLVSDTVGVEHEMSWEKLLIVDLDDIAESDYE